MIYLQLFLSFLQIGLFSIGGGYAAIPIIKSQAVDHYGWLSMSEFTDLVTIAEMTPGPIAVNSATFVGIRVANLGGAIIATLGCILPSLFIVSILFFLYYRYKNMPILQSILSSLRPAVVALILSAGISILLQVIFGGVTYNLQELNIVGIILFTVAFILLRTTKLSPIIIMVMCGIINLVVNLII